MAVVLKINPGFDAAYPWRQIGTGVPTLLEVDGLAEPEAADVDLPLMEFVENIVDSFFTADASLILAEYEEMSLEEIMRATGSELAAVKSRLHRAREHLRKALGRYLKDG